MRLILFGFSNKYGPIFYKFSAFTQLVAALPVGQVILCRISWNNLYVQAYTNFLLGPNRQAARTKIALIRRHIFRNFKMCFEIVKQAKKRIYAKGSFFLAAKSTEAGGC